MRTGLVGRHNEMRLARAALASHGVVILIGPSGVGKTAIADSLRSEWLGDGPTREVRGIQGLKHVPFGALTLALQVEGTKSDSETLTNVVRALTGADGRPLVIADDAHLLDAESAAIVSGLAQSADVALVLSITSGEIVSPDITSVWARWPEARLDIAPLGRDDVAELLAALLGPEISEDFADEVFSISLGYPLYVTALAAEYSAHAGDIVTSLDADFTSDRLIRLMERRLSRLDREQRRLFDAVAFAESIPPAVVLGSGDESDLNPLIEAELIRRSGDRVHVAHPLLGSVARETLTTEGRKICARQLLDGLDATSPTADVAATVRKALSVGVVPHVDQVRTAATVALNWGDFEGVSRLTDLYPDDPGLQVLRAQAARFLGEVPEASVPAGLDDAALTDYLSGASQGIAYGERRFTDAIDFLREGMAAVVEPANRDRLALELMVLSGLVGDLDALLGAARAVGPSADPNTRLLAISATQLAEALTLSTISSMDTYAVGRAIADNPGSDEFLVEQLEISRFAVEIAEGRFGSARERYDTFGDRKLVGSWKTACAVLADAWLPLEQAAELADSAVVALEEFDPLANLAQARIVADLRQAQMGTAPPEPDAGVLHEQGVMDIDRIMNRRVDAWLAWSAQDPTAGKHLAEIGRDAIAMGHRLWGLCALIDATRLGVGESVAADIDHLVITRGAGLSVLAGRHARAESPAELWASAVAWWTAGAPVYAVEAALRAAQDGSSIHALGAAMMLQRGALPVVTPELSLKNPLTERQTQVVAGAIDGQSNDVIAAELFLSRRTVENHLHRIYGELGLSDGRDELIAVFGFLGGQA